MIDFFKKILSLPLFYIIITIFLSCTNNIKDNKSSENSHTFLNNFDNETQFPIWKNQYVTKDSLSFSGDYVCEVKPDKKYAFGFDLDIHDSIAKQNAVFNIDMMLRSESELNARFVFSIQNGKDNVLWTSYPLSEGFSNDNQWYKTSIEVKAPNDVLIGSRLNCYVLNENKELFFIDDFSFTIKYYTLPAYIDEIKEYKSPNHLTNITDSEALNILYSNKENKIVLADEYLDAVSNPISLFYSLIVNNDTIEIQSADWKLVSDVEGNYIFENDNKIVDTKLMVCYKDNNPNVNFTMESEYHKDVKVLKSSLIIPFLENDFSVYRRNPFVDKDDYQDVYYLDKEGFSLNLDDTQINIYHPDNVSSIQLDTRKSIAYINTDYHYDHLLIRFELMDTVDCYVDNSATFMKKTSSHISSFSVSLTDKTDLARIMPVMDGYESAFIWTEHADWTDIKTHRATYFGSEDVENIDDAVGGFAYYNIPVTKSIFYNNPDSVNNYEKNNDFPGLHSTIMTDTLFFDFLKQLKSKGFDICLHTPEQYTTTQDNLSEALSFMKESFASPSWIDHGYNNLAHNNRENMVCDGLDSSSPYYVYELWKENGVRYPWNASYEDMRPFETYLFENNLLRPYPGFGDALPLPRVSKMTAYPEIMLWSTPCTVEPGLNKLWDYYFSQKMIDKIVDFRYVYITHIYAAWVEEERGFWEVKDGKYVAKAGFNRALEKLAELEKQRYLLPTTIDKYMKYQEQLQSLEYRLEADGTVVLRNNNKESIKGLSLISVRNISLDDGKQFNRRKTKSGDENIIWFDMEPDEVVRIVNEY